MLARGDLTLGLVAGGQGRRLGGVAKGLLEVGGRPVLAWLLELGPRASEVLLGTSHPTPYAAFGLAVVPDVMPGKGAPGGVVSLLLAAKTPWVLCVACDMPFVRLAHVEALLAHAGDDVDVVVASRRRSRGPEAPVREPGGAMGVAERGVAGAAALEPSIEPLLGLYRSALGQRWRDRLEQNPSLRALVASARWRAVELDPDALDSVNTPDELARARARRG